MATPTNPPLYLHVTSTSKEGLDKAVAKIEELMKQELPQLVDERRFRRRDQEQQQVERDEYGRRKWPEERITIGLESVPGFNLRAQVVGHGGAYVKHIQQETQCRVQIKGRGSGYIEASTGLESEDDMFLHVTGPDAKMVEKAKELCEDLLANVREQYEEFKARPPRGYGGSGGYGDRSHGHGGSSYQSYNNDYRSQGNSYNSPTTAAVTSAVSPTAAASTPASATDYAAQYAQYYGGADPYAAYGGYQAYMQMYQTWYAAQQAQAGGAAAPPGTSASPPPPPPSEAAPPPPPSAAPPPPPAGAPPGVGAYGAVPPPPGL
ncbi:KH domain-containing protein [Echria macrotheca]|uniref:KH domain-containing protein n=1 Tax=Echria macrotheca TaxID=438768 RepID=A0AAJ0F8E7_9PEZI|nr:KH domain-containing protein [Echria macrotheca]